MIKLLIPENIKVVAGYELGNSIFIDQVIPEVIDLKSTIYVKIPIDVERITNSFVSGAKSSLYLAGVEGDVIFISGNSIHENRINEVWNRSVLR